MGTPGNTPTTTTAVLNEIVAQLESIPGLANVVFISAAPVFLGSGYPGDQYVEVVPGASSDAQARAGYGYSTDTVTIGVYKRLLTDQAEQDTQKIASSTAGILLLVDAIDAKLVQNFLNAKLTNPLIPRRREAAQVPIEGAGWVYIARIFEMKYITDFAAPQAYTS